MPKDLTCPASGSKVDARVLRQRINSRGEKVERREDTDAKDNKEKDKPRDETQATQMELSQSQPAKVGSSRVAKGSPADAEFDKADKVIQDRRKQRQQHTETVEGGKLTAVMIRYLLNMGASVRTLQAITIQSYEVDAEGPLAEQMKVMGRSYHVACAEAGRGHGYGPPGIYLVMGLAKALIEGLRSKDEADLANRMDRWMDDYRDLEPEDATMIVPHCALKIMFNPKFKRLELSLADAAQTQLYRLALTRLGNKKFIGPAPRGGKGDMLQKALNSM